MSEDLLLLTAREVQSLLDGRERDVIQIVRQAYEAHAAGQTALPHSTFLRFPGQPRNRIIALPAYLDGAFEIAGLKWVASFPDNHAVGLPRASAVVVLNSPQTGRPLAFMDGALISAQRTAASAALAAQMLHPDEPGCVTLIGCGVINREIARFLRAVYPGLRRFVLHDTDSGQARRFQRDLAHDAPDLEIAVQLDLAGVLAAASLVSLATTALQPHISDLSVCPARTTILHVSLRDLTPEVILHCSNVVDDIDHVCRASTSIHLAEQNAGHRGFIATTLGDMLLGKGGLHRDDKTVTVFSPFGLGILDIAVAQWVYRRAREEKRGTLMNGFCA